MMITLTSKLFTKFVLEHNLKDFHCTVMIDQVNLSTKFIFTDDICRYQLTETTLERVYFDRDKSAEFSFFVPDNIQVMSLADMITITCHNDIVTVTLEIIKPAIMITVKTEGLELEPMYKRDIPYYPMSQFKDTVNSIKQLKGLASDLSIVSDLEFNNKFWSVSIAQCCLFGVGNGIDGIISSQVFEKVYDFRANIAMISNTVAQMIGELEGGSYIIEIPVKTSKDKFPDLIPGMVNKCSRKVCDCIMTNDVSSIVRELLKTVKKDAIDITFSDHRFDLEYNTIKVNMRTNAGKIEGNKISVKVPIKMLNPISSMLNEELEILTNGDLICMMKDNKGMILTGLVS